MQRPDGAVVARKKSGKRARQGKPGAAWLSVTPAAGQCLLLAPGAVRRLRGGRVCLTTWWWKRPPVCGTPLPPPLVFNSVLAEAARMALPLTLILLLTPTLTLTLLLTLLLTLGAGGARAARPAWPRAVGRV